MQPSSSSNKGTESFVHEEVVDERLELSLSQNQESLSQDEGSKEPETGMQQRMEHDQSE